MKQSTSAEVIRVLHDGLLSDVSQEQTASSLMRCFSVLPDEFGKPRTDESVRSLQIVFADETAFCNGFVIVGARDVHACASRLGAALARVGIGAFDVQWSILDNDLRRSLTSLRRAIQEDSASLAVSDPAFRLLGTSPSAHSVIADDETFLAQPSTSDVARYRHVARRLAELATLLDGVDSGAFDAQSLRVLEGVARSLDVLISAVPDVVQAFRNPMSRSEIVPSGAGKGVGRGARAMAVALLVLDAVSDLQVDVDQRRTLLRASLCVGLADRVAAKFAPTVARGVIRESELSGEWFDTLPLVGYVLDRQDPQLRPDSPRVQPSLQGHLIAVAWRLVARLDAASVVSWQEALDRALNETGANTGFGPVARDLIARVLPRVPVASSLFLAPRLKPALEEVSLNDVTVAQLLVIARQLQFSGCLRLSAGLARTSGATASGSGFEIWLKNGVVKRVVAEGHGRLIGEILVDANVAAKPKIEACVVSAKGMGLLLGEYLVSDATVSRADLEYALEVQILERLLAFATQSGTVSWVEEAAEDLMRSQFEPTFANLIVTLVRGSRQAKPYREALTELQGLSIALRPEASSMAIAFTPFEREVFNALLQSAYSSVADLAGSASVAIEAAEVVVLALVILGELSVDGRDLIRLRIPPTSKLPPPLVTHWARTAETDAAAMSVARPLRLERPAIRATPVAIKTESKTNERTVEAPPSSLGGAKSVIRTPTMTTLPAALAEIELALASEQWDEALARVRACLELVPARPDLQLLQATIGVCSQPVGSGVSAAAAANAAIELAEALLELSPRADRPLLCVALLHLHAGSKDKAIDQLRVLLSAHPKHVAGKRIMERILG
jgi:hypothetical protein